MTWKEKLIGSVATAAWLAIGASYVWPTVSPEYSDVIKARIFLVWLAAGIALLLWVIGERRGRRMSFIEFVIWGGGLGMLAGVVAWGVYALGEKPSEAAHASQNTSGTNATDGVQAKLPLTMRPPNGFTVTSTQVVRMVKQEPKYSTWKAFLRRNITNRGNRRVSLSFRLLFRVKADDGTFRWSFMSGVWSENEDWKSGRNVINIDPDSTAAGWLIFDVLSPESESLGTLNGRWSFDAMWVEITDLISGVTTGCDEGIYPPDVEIGDIKTFSKRHSEGLTPPANSDSRKQSPQSLDLLFRPKHYSHSDTQVEMPAALTNRSKRRMGLSITLLISNPPDGKTWQQFSGRWNGSREDRTSGEQTLKIEPDETVDGILIFDLPNPKITGREKWELGGERKNNLIEISDRVSGARVWCTMYEGYPPGLERPWVPIRFPADDLGV